MQLCAPESFLHSLPQLSVIVDCVLCCSNPGYVLNCMLRSLEHPGLYGLWDQTMGSVQLCGLEKVAAFFLSLRKRYN